MIRRIAIFTPYTIPHLGGVERYVHNMSVEMAKLGVEVVVVGTDYNFTGVYEDERDGIKYLFFPIHNLFSSRYPVVKKTGRAYGLVMDKLIDGKFDAVIVNTRFFLTSLLGAKFGKMHNIPVFLVEHGSQHLTVDNRVLDFLGGIYEHGITKLIKRYVDRYYGVSQAACEWQKHFGIESNGVWSNSINEFEYERDTAHQDINITYAGRILPQKGVEALIIAFKELEKQHRNIHLYIAGDGNQREELEKNYHEEGITFLGRLEFEELKHIYEKTDIFVYAPLWPEGLPTAILEVGYMGIPVIGSPQGGIKELIENGNNGLTVLKNKTLKDCLKELIEDEQLRIRLGSKLRDKITSNYRWNVTARRMLEDIGRYCSDV